METPERPGVSFWVGATVSFLFHSTGFGIIKTTQLFTIQWYIDVNIEGYSSRRSVKRR
ncbi:hypothetical protein B4113_1562 [Geobacillus sp. B4113_201601]|nr:hypothetical protein B4113_1562 [Geobacillus sp. B4113_201601]